MRQLVIDQCIDKYDCCITRQLVVERMKQMRLVVAKPDPCKQGHHTNKIQKLDQPDRQSMRMFFFPDSDIDAPQSFLNVYAIYAYGLLYYTADFPCLPLFLLTGCATFLSKPSCVLSVY